MKKKYLIVFALIFLIIGLLSNPVFSQKQEECYISKYNDVFDKNAKITMLNDVNPILNQKSDDFGYTLGVIGSYRFVKPEKNSFYEFELESHLYTKPAFSSYINQDGRRIYSQYFTEISSFNFTINQYLEKSSFFIDLKTYVGIYNKKKAILGGGLFLQGGSDGKGGYHALLENNPGQDNISLGGQSILFYIEPGLKKYFIAKVFSKNDNAFLEIHPNIKLGFPIQGISASVNVNSELPIMQFISKENNIFKLTLCYRHKLSMHRDGLSYIPELGVQASLLSLTLGYTSNFYFGNRNISMLNHIDDERMMRLYIKIEL
jgi:hypothetical protein